MNKKITFGLVLAILIVLIFGIYLGAKQYKEEHTDLASQNVVGEEICIITIQGNTYDVTDFRYKHEGGDVFKCGEDMTQSFQGKHKGYLPMIEKFKVD